MREYHKRQHDLSRSSGRRPRGHRREPGYRRRDNELRPHGLKFRRRFATRDERIARLETYLGELRSEAQAVEERIAELKAGDNS